MMHGVQLQIVEKFDLNLMNAIPDCVVLLDTSGRLVFMNTQGMGAMEIDDFASVSGQHWEALWPEEARGEVARALAQAAGGEVSSFQACCPAAEGTQKYWESTLSPVRDAEDGHIVHLLAVCRDITERKLAEDALRGRETFISGVLGSITDGFLALDKDWQFTFVNDQMLTRFGLRRDEILGRNIWQLFPAAVGTEAYVQLQRAMAERATVEYAFFYEPWQRWFADKAFPTLDGGLALYTQDVTDARQASQQLRASEDRYRTLFESMDEGYCVIEVIFDGDARAVDYRFIEINPAFEKHTGLTGSAGRRARELVPDLEEHWFKMYGQVALTGEPVRFIDEAKAMEERWFDVYAFRIGEDGSDKVAVLFTDITARQRAGAALRVIEERSAFVRRSSGVGFWYCDLPFDVLEWDELVKAHFHLPPDAAVTIHTFYDRIHPEDREQTRLAIELSIARHTHYNVDYRTVNPDTGAMKWVRAIGRTFYATDGTPTRFDGVTLDVSDQKRAEADLRESEQRFRLVADAAPVLIWMSGTDKLRYWFNQPWLDYTGRTLGMEVGNGWAEGIHPDDVARCLEMYSAAFDARTAFSMEYRLRRHDGEFRWLIDNGVPRYNSGGALDGYIGSCVDVSDYKNAEAALRDSHHLKDEFLATLAHELRNPLAPIRNGLQLIKLAGSQQATIEQARSMMDRQLTQMVRLVDDLMDVGRISQRKLELRREPVPLALVLQSAVETSGALIDKKGQQLTVTLPPHAILVDADTTRLAQVFLNLLNNASKYTNAGGHIHLNVARDVSDVLVTVKDNGIGIAEDQLPRIFEMFMQVGGSLERSQGGLGIGLTLVKRLVELHGGSVDAKSEGAGKGSEFVVRLPLLNDATEQRRPGADEQLSAPELSLRILVVDDNRDAADSLAEMLQIMGNDARTAYGGREGVDIAGEFRPDVILLDIGLPKLNGHDACCLIRDQPWGKAMVVIALTGWGQDRDRQLSQEAGFDHHLVKPVDPQALIKMLEGLNIGRDRQRPNGPPGFQVATD